MREVLDELLGWWRAGEPVGMATVVNTWRSAPRQPGAAMLVGPDGSAVGSVSGGCVEAAVYELGEQVRTGGPAGLARYGVSDDDAFAVGLTCGGTIELFVERVDRGSFPDLDRVAEAIAAGTPVAVATVVSVAADAAAPGAADAGAADAAAGTEPGAADGPGPPATDGAPGRVGARLVVWPDRCAGTLGSRRLDDAATDDVRGMLAAGRTGMLRYGRHGERRGDELALFVATFAPRPRMIVFGAIDFAAAVARVGDFLGYRVTVCDARPVFATRRRFPGIDDVVVDWPHRYLAGEIEAGRVDPRTVVCVLTHDPKFDVPVLQVALAHPLAYVGAMGSRRTHDDRIARLREAGVPAEQLSRLASPIGLDLGARTPEETAISVAAEIVAVRWGGRGERLSAVAGRIHHD